MPLQIIRQDITAMEVDAIVNPTNRNMIGYSGIDQAVHLKAGPKLDRECAKRAPLELGHATITKGYGLKTKYIIHTAGPVWQGGGAGESVYLRSCYMESLMLAAKHGCETVAFPLISSGNYGYPKDQVLKFAVQIISEFLLEYEMTVYLCVFDRSSYEFRKSLFSRICSFIENDCEQDFLEENRNVETIRLDSPSPPCQVLPNEQSTEPMPPHRPFLAPSAPPPSRSSLSPLAPPPEMPRAVCSKEQKGRPRAKETLAEYLKSMDKSFAYKLFDWIDKRGMTDVECYKKANVDKKTFSKIKCNPLTYKPSKQTAVAFAIALRLDLEETQDLLASAGLTLSRSFTFDKIIRYFIQKEIYDIFEINEALFEFDQVLLGCL